ncbi:hypothetical protein PENTCL1PPCAC_5006, partial [Pristionchus entomophagus]
MNTTELGRDFQSAVILSQHIYGSMFLVINAFLCILVVSDKDRRGKSYRKYLFCLQLFSSIADVELHIYSPFVQANCRVAYADSILMLYFACIAEIGASYFLCVYYRRNVI